MRHPPGKKCQVLYQADAKICYDVLDACDKQDDIISDDEVQQSCKGAMPLLSFIISNDVAMLVTSMKEPLEVWASAWSRTRHIPSEESVC